MANPKQSTNAAGSRQKFYFQFITTPTSDTPGTALLLHFDNRRYIFGRIAEGTQRACIQRGIGIKKVRSLFLTGPTSWDSMGGLIGMVLTMADVQYEERDPETGKRPTLRIQGGPKLMHSIACARRFVFRTGMPLEIHEVNMKASQWDQPSYIDENITVWSVPVVRRGRSGANSPRAPTGRSLSSETIEREQMFRADTVKNMFDSDWRKDRLVESRFDEVKLPALVWTRNPDTKELNYTQCATMKDAPHLAPDSKVLVRNPWPASLVDELPSANNFAGSISLSYIVKGKPQRGKFIPEKATELGVKSGPNRAVLASGGSVTLESGKVITPDMVLGKTEPGKGMAIFDVPTDEYLEDLSEKIDHLREPLAGIETVSWLLGAGVMTNPSFALLLEKLPGLQHLISAPDVCSDHIALDSAAASTIRLAQICPECFATPVHDNDSATNPVLTTGIPYISAERGLIVHAAPKAFLNRSEVPPLLDIGATKASYRDVLRDLIPASSQSFTVVEPFDDIQIITLGTGSAVPSKYRNVSGTLVRIPDLGSYLFDCGENTLGMLRRVYSAAELDEVLADLRFIWISHLHADHHLGTMSIVDAKRKVMQRLAKTEPKLYVVGEPNMADYLNDYSSIQSSMHCELLGVLNSAFTSKNLSSLETEIAISQTSLPIKEFLTTRVSHCHGAQACSVTFENGFKFSYSGDCRPSAQFAQIGQHSDVLLHEATFDDGLEGHAMAKKHSTTAEALAVAHAMQAKNVVLTHFSQRYQKIPVLSNVKFDKVRFEEGDDEEEPGPIEDDRTGDLTDAVLDESHTIHPVSATPQSVEADAEPTALSVAQSMNVCVAFDLMSVKVGQIRDMHRYYPAMEKMFLMELEKSEAKRDARRIINDRLKEEKDSKENKSKGQAGKKEKLDTSPAKIELYERINRNNVKKNKGAAASQDRPKVDDTLTGSSNATGIAPTRGTAPDPPVPMSKRTAKRQARKLELAKDKDREKKEKQEEDQVLSQKPAAAVEPGLLSRNRQDGHVRGTRQLSAEPEVSDRKRVKLAEGEIQTSEHNS